MLRENKVIGLGVVSIFARRGRIKASLIRKSVKPENPTSGEFPRQQAPGQQPPASRPDLAREQKCNVNLSVFRNWWICFYLQYRFTITTSTNIFITPPPPLLRCHECLQTQHNMQT